MGSARPDPFEQFVAKHGLRVTAEDLAAYPRDVLAAPADLERHVLVSLVSPGGQVPPVHSLFVVGATDTRPASMRDVMWWLSADSWAYERAGGDLHRWAATYGYPDDDPATLRLMRLHAQQAQALVALMGQGAYAELLNLYEAEIQRASRAGIRRPSQRLGSTDIGKMSGTHRPRTRLRENDSILPSSNDTAGRIGE